MFKYFINKVNIIGLGNNMNEKLLYESELNIVEATPNAPETILPGTGQTDIAQQVPKTTLARNVMTASLPFMIGYVQPLKTPAGFVFGFKDRGETAITHADMPYSNQQPPSAERTGNAPGTPPDAAAVKLPSTTTNSKFDTLSADPMTIADIASLDGENPAVPAYDVTPTPEDPVIIRRMVETEVREVVFDMTNEVIQDIEALFRNDFPQLLRTFIENGGELFGFPESDSDTGAASFFLPQMMNKAVTKINTDFIEWADSAASVLGDVDIPTIDDMARIFTAIGEMREALANETKKSGSVFILCTPRIANYLSGTLGMTMSNGGEILERGKPNQSPNLNGFIGQYGDVKIYQYRGARTATGDSIIMGFDGSNGPNTASVYYHPY
jgi:hypothetical protein